VNEVCEAMFGALVGPECRRALRGGSVFVARSVAVLPPCLVLLCVAWVCWVFPSLDPSFSPAGTLWGGLLAVEGLLVTAALILGPAVLAAALVGDKARGMLGLLQICQLSSWEIVAGRLAGRLCLVGVLLLGSLPPLAALAAAWDQGLAGLASLAMLPASLALGGGGIALGLSAVARRGRDALLTAYLLVILLAIAPRLLGAFWPMTEGWLGPLGPYEALRELVESGDCKPILCTSGVWGFVGVAGAGLAAWRLRLTSSPEGSTHYRFRKWRRVPPIGGRPLMWKELHIEPRQSLHRFTRWAVGAAAISLLAGTSSLAVVLAWDRWVRPDPERSGWADDLLGTLMQWSWLLSWLIQWAVALRAAGAIVVERERGTWDAILMSSLEGREIFQAKVLGSIYGVRGLMTAALVSWTLGLACGALTFGQYANLLGETLVVSAFMAILGSWFSLSCETAMRAMTWTMGAWLATRFAVMVLAGVATGVSVMAGMLASLYWETMTGRKIGTIAGTAPNTWLLPAYQTIWMLVYGLATLAMAYYCRHRFDRLVAPVLGDPAAMRE
jgi:hypothetical protein